MFIITGSYVVPIEEVERVLPKHWEFLDKLNKDGILVLSGPMKPRTGGAIILKLDSREEVDRLLEKDPFYIEHIVDYNIIQFIPTKANCALSNYIERK